MPTDLTAPEQRAQDTLFVSTCRWTALRDQLPLPWPTPPDTPPSPKHRYRSHYVYRGYADLNDPTTWEHLTDFDLVLRLVDFTGLRPVLAQRLGWVSARGYEPFDPLSFFLLNGWQLTNHWTRTDTLKHVRDDRYADYDPAQYSGITPNALVMSRASSPPKAACAISSPRWANIPKGKRSRWMPKPNSKWAGNNSTT